jgi:hypothetical protein
MSASKRSVDRFLCRAMIGLALLAVGVDLAWSQNNNQGFFNRAVGGILIDADGIVANADPEACAELARLRLEVLEPVAEDLRRPNAMRTVSLRGLQGAIAAAAHAGADMPDDVRYLAGLQSIRYVFAYPELQDIVLVGFGEGWKVDPRGNVVGESTGLPVLLLDDLLVAVRSAHGAARGGISCSIDPTAEGLSRLQSFADALKGSAPSAAALGGIEEALGPQSITVSGVPATSHFARVLVAADYRMKRIAMNFEPSPVAGLKSYLEMIGGRSRAGVQNMLPRWWLAPDYEPLATDAPGLSWELRGGVKAESEEDFLSADGTRQRTGRTGGATARWAASMTEHYTELSRQEPIFAELKNLMDFAVVAALITKEDLAEKAGCDLGVLLDEANLPADEFAAAERAPSIASVIENRRSWVITASGGVLIDSWGVADRKETTSELDSLRDQFAQSRGADWWSN